MLTRRTLLTTLASLPLLGWVKPKPLVDAGGGFIVPEELTEACEAALAHDGVIFGDTFVVPVGAPQLTIEEVCRLRGVPYQEERS